MKDNAMYTRRYELGLVALLFIAWGTVFMDRMALPFLSPYIKPDLGLTDAQLGNLNAVLALGWAASTFTLGALSDRIGRKPVLVPSLIIVAVLTALSGVVKDYESLLIVRGLLGIAEGPIWATMAALVSESSSERTRGSNVAVVLSAGTIIGLAIAPVLMTQIASSINWHAAFFVAGGPVLLVGILVAVFVNEPRASQPHHHHHKPTLQDFKRLIATPNLWLCALAASAFMSWLYLFNAFGPLYMVEVQGLDPRVGGMVMGVSGVGGVALGFLMVWLAGRIGRKAAALIMALLAISAPLMLLVPNLYSPPWLLASLQFLTNCSVGITTLVLVVAAAESVPANTAAAAIGVVSMFGEIVGATAMPALGGALASRYGLQAPLLLAGASAAVLTLAIAGLRFYRLESTPQAPVGVGQVPSAA
jgi:predicted MFS family arabinose efflux permease